MLCLLALATTSWLYQINQSIEKPQFAGQRRPRKMFFAAVLPPCPIPVPPPRPHPPCTELRDTIDLLSDLLNGTAAVFVTESHGNSDVPNTDTRGRTVLARKSRGNPDVLTGGAEELDQERIMGEGRGGKAAVEVVRQLPPLPFVRCYKFPPPVPFHCCCFPTAVSASAAVAAALVALCNRWSF